MSLDSKLPFGRDFQIGLLALMLQKSEKFLRFKEMIKPEYFEDQILIYFYQKITGYYADYQEKPTHQILSEILLKDARRKVVKESKLEDYFQVWEKLNHTVSEEKYLTEELKEFCKRQATKKVILEKLAPRLSDSGSLGDSFLEEIMSNFKDILSIGNSFDDLGLNYSATIHERLLQRISGEDVVRKFITGIDDLDHYTYGGLEEKQIGIIIGSTGHGKSIVLSHFAKTAAFVGNNVIYFSLFDLSEKKAAMRLDSSFSSIPDREIVDNVEEFKKRMKRIEKNERIFIKEYMTQMPTIGMLRANIQAYCNAGIKPDLIIVDYMDHVVAPNPEEKDLLVRERLKGNALRALGAEFGAGVWTAAQTNRTAWLKENVDHIDRANVKGGADKVMDADLIVVMRRNPEEVKKNRLRFYIDKNRNGPSGMEFKIGTNYECFRLEEKIVEAEDDASDDTLEMDTPPKPSKTRKKLRRKSQK